jgi:hypothetical protein
VGCHWAHLSSSHARRRASRVAAGGRPGLRA